MNLTLHSEDNGHIRVSQSSLDQTTNGQWKQRSARNIHSKQYDPNCNRLQKISSFFGNLTTSYIEDTICCPWCWNSALFHLANSSSTANNHYADACSSQSELGRWWWDNSCPQPSQMQYERWLRRRIGASISMKKCSKESKIALVCELHSTNIGLKRGRMKSRENIQFQSISESAKFHRQLAVSSFVMYNLTCIRFKVWINIIVRKGVIHVLSVFIYQSFNDKALWIDESFTFGSFVFISMYSLFSPREYTSNPL